MISMAWADLRLHPLRNVLTAVSLFVGVMAVVGIVVVGALARDQVLAGAERLSGRGPTFEASLGSRTPLTGGRVAFLLGRLPHTPAVAVEARADQPLVVVTPPLSPDAPVTAEAVEVRLVAGDVRGVYRLPMVSGRWLGADEDNLPYEAVANVPAARRFAAGRIGLTGPASTDVTSVRLVGVTDDGTQSPALYVKLGPLAMHAPHLVTVADLTTRWHAEGLEAHDVERRVRDLATDTSVDFSGDVARVDNTEALADVLDALQSAFTAAAALALVVAALGILNVGLGSIRERSHELAVRRAVGAPRLALFGLVIVSALISAVGVAGLAVLLSVAAVATLPWWLDGAASDGWPTYPWEAAAVGVGTAVITSVLGSLAPAIVAARTQPSDALRL